MILVRAPMRISFAGGGSDLPAFYREEPGACFSATISAYMNLVVNRKFDGDVRVSYSKTENVRWARQIEHDIARETMLYCGLERSVEIVSISDVPAGTGLGSSSAYAVALLQALYAYRHDMAEPPRLAENACQVEIERCKHPIGKQDQYAAAFGGLRLYTFGLERVIVDAAVASDLANELQRHLMLWYTGKPREANGILHQQNDALNSGKARSTVRRLVSLAQEMHAAARDAKLSGFAEMLDEAWRLKQEITPAIASAEANALIAKAKQAGAISGKLCGAGGSGFVLLFVPPEKQNAVRMVLNVRPCRELRFHFEPRGSRIIYGIHRNQAANNGMMNRQVSSPAYAAD